MICDPENSQQPPILARKFFIPDFYVRARRRRALILFSQERCFSKKADFNECLMQRYGVGFHGSVKDLTALYSHLRQSPPASESCQKHGHL